MRVGGLGRIGFCIVILSLVVCGGQAYAFGKVQEVKTSTGITAWLIEDHSLPLIAVKGAVKYAGSAYGEKNLDGLPSLATSMLMEGAGEYDDKAFQELLDEHGIRMGFEAEQDHMFFAMETLSEQSAKAFEVLGLAMAKPRMDKESFARVRQDRLAQLDLMMAKPEYVSSVYFQQQVYADHPYAYVQDGTPESIAKITLEDASRFIKEHMVRDRLVLAVIGDVTPEQLKALMEQAFSALPETAKGDAERLLDVHYSNLGKSWEKSLDVPQSVVVFGLPAVARNDARFYAAYIVNYMLGGGGLSSRLSQSIREREGLSYYVYSGLQLSEKASILRGALASRFDQADRAIALLQKEIADAGEKGFTQTELDAAKQYIMGSFPLSLDSGKEMANYLLSMQLQSLGQDYLEKRNGYIQNVALQEVNDVARQLLKPEKLMVVKVGKTIEKGNVTSLSGKK